MKKRINKQIIEYDDQNKKNEEEKEFLNQNIKTLKRESSLPTITDKP